MTVLRLVEYRCAETIRILKALLSMAALGKTRGVAICYLDEEGEEHAIYTGAYKARRRRLVP